MNSFYMELNNKDWQKGLVVSVLGAVVATLTTALNSGSFDVMTYNWSMVLQVALSAGGSYLLKNLLSDENGQVNTPFGKIG